MTQVPNQQPAKPKLTALQQVICAWPLALVIIGGALGGLCGGVAWGINTRIMSSGISAPARYGLCVLTGIVAAVVWYFAALALAPLIASMFASH
jgi:MFS family permease